MMMGSKVVGCVVDAGVGSESVPQRSPDGGPKWLSLGEQRRQQGGAAEFCMDGACVSADVHEEARRHCPAPWTRVCLQMVFLCAALPALSDVGEPSDRRPRQRLASVESTLPSSAGSECWMPARPRTSDERGTRRVKTQKRAQKGLSLRHFLDAQSKNNVNLGSFPCFLPICVSGEEREPLSAIPMPRPSRAGETRKTRRRSAVAHERSGVLTRPAHRVGRTTR